MTYFSSNLGSSRPQSLSSFYCGPQEPRYEKALWEPSPHARHTLTFNSLLGGTATVRCSNPRLWREWTSGEIRNREKILESSISIDFSFVLSKISSWTLPTTGWSLSFGGPVVGEVHNFLREKTQDQWSPIHTPSTISQFFIFGNRECVDYKRWSVDWKIKMRN